MEKSSKYFTHHNMNNKDSWDNYGEGVDGDLLGGFIWPPRSYTCSFCKREFRSAQALGGHMNVHRRDRARLRLQSPPRLLNLNLEPNPNPNPSTSPNPSTFVSSPPSSPPSRKIFHPFVSRLPPLISPPSFSSSNASGSNINGDLTKMGNARTEKFDNFMLGKECSQEVVKRSEFLRLDLGIGLLNESKEDLDLELRLGYT